MKGKSKKCQNLSNAMKYRRIFPASTIGKKHNEKTRNAMIGIKIDFIDPEDFFVLSFGFVIIKYNFWRVINLFEK